MVDRGGAASPVAEPLGAATHLAVEQGLGAGAAVDQVVSQLRRVSRAEKAR